MVWFGAIAELTSVGATTFISLIGTTRIMASRAAQRTAASDAGDPSTPTTMLDRAACQHIASSPLEVPLAIMAPALVAVIVAANSLTMPAMSKRTPATTRAFRWRSGVDVQVTYRRYRDHRHGTGPIVAHIDTFPVGADRHRFGIAGHVDGRRDRVRDRVDHRERAIAEIGDVRPFSVGTELQTP